MKEKVKWTLNFYFFIFQELIEGVETTSPKQILKCCQYMNCANMNIVANFIKLIGVMVSRKIWRRTITHISRVYL